MVMIKLINIDYDIILLDDLDIMADKIKNVETGISGLDDMLNGGIPSKNHVLIAGGPGTAKSLLAFEMSYRRAKDGTPCAYIALDETPESIIKNAKRTFTSMNDIDKIIISGYYSATKVSTNTTDETGYSIGLLMSDIENIIKTNDSEFVVIDSLSFLKLMLGKSLLYNKTVASLISNLRRLDTTSVTTLEIPYYDKKRMKFGQELLLFDGVMALYNIGDKGKDEYALQVVKMRGSNHSRALVKYGITADGLKFRQ